MCVCECVSVCAQWRRTPCNPINCSPPSSPVHGIFQTRILEWIAISSSRGPSRPRDQARVSCISCIGRRILYPLSQPGKPIYPDPFPQVRTTDQSWGMEVLKKKKTKRTVFKLGKVFAPGAWEKPSGETKKSPRCRGKECRRGPRKVGGNPEWARPRRERDGDAGATATTMGPNLSDPRPGRKASSPRRGRDRAAAPPAGP